MSISNFNKKKIDWRETRYLLFLSVGIVAAFAVYIRLGLVIGNQILFPFDLVFETANLSTILAFRDGLNPYAENTYGGVSFNLTMYAPLYHLFVSYLPHSEGNPFLAGRIVALLSMVGALSASFAVARDRRNWLLPILGGAIFFCLPFAVQSSTLIKSDPLALFFSVWAVVLISRAKDNRYAHFGAATLVLLALATKQSYGAGFLACGAFLLINHRAKLPRFLLFTFLGGVVLAGLAHVVFGPGFWFSIVKCAANPMEWAQATKVLKSYVKVPVLVALSVIAILAAFHGRWKGESPPPWHSPYFLYVVTSAATLFLTVGKNGSAENYFYEVIVAQILWVIDASRGDIREKLGNWRFQMGLGAICCCLLFDAVPLRYKAYLATPPDLQKARIAGSAVWWDLLARNQIENPKVLHLNTHLFTHDLQRRAVFSDPLLYQILWGSGKLSHETLLDAITEKSFDLIIGSQKMRFSEALNGEFQRAIDRDYYHWKRTPYGDCYRPKPSRGAVDVDPQL